MSYGLSVQDYTNSRASTSSTTSSGASGAQSYDENAAVAERGGEHKVTQADAKSKSKAKKANGHKDKDRDRKDSRRDAKDER